MEKLGGGRSGKPTTKNKRKENNVCGALALVFPERDSQQQLIEERGGGLD